MYRKGVTDSLRYKNISLQEATLVLVNKQQVLVNEQRFEVISTKRYVFVRNLFTAIH
jgi:hypothetical protein